MGGFVWSARRTATLSQGVSALAKFLAARGWTGSTDGADFESGTYWLDGALVDQATWAARFSTTATVERIYTDQAGVKKNDLVSGAIRWDWRGGRRYLVQESAVTNKVTCQKHNPTGTTNVTKGGDAAATLSRVDATADLAAIGWGTICSNGYVYRLDNSAGTTNATATLGGTTANTNKHSFDVLARAVSGSGTMQLSAGAGPVTINRSSFYRWKSQNVTPGSSSDQLQIVAPAGAVIDFILPCLVQNAACPWYPIPGATTASVTKATERFNLPASLVAKLNGSTFSIMINNAQRINVGILYDLGYDGYNIISAVNDGSTVFVNNGTNWSFVGIPYSKGATGVATVTSQDGTGWSLTPNNVDTPATGAYALGTVSNAYIGESVSSDSGGTLTASVLFFPTRDDTRAKRVSKVAPLLSAIECWGDSLTAGQGSTTGNDFPSVLARLYPPDVIVNNNGIGGQTAAQIAARRTSGPVYDPAYAVIWVGRNNITDPDQSKAAVAAIVALIPSGRYIVVSETNRSDEPSGSANYITMTALNAYFASLYGAKYLDVRSALVALGAPGQPYADAVRYPQDLIPSGLMSDSTHLNDAGYAVVAAAVKAKADALGYPGA